MSEEHLKELEDKIHEVQMEKLLNIEYVAKQMKESKDNLAKLKDELEGIQRGLIDCQPNEVNKYKTMISAVKAKIDLVGQWKAMLQQYRLLIRNLEKELQILIARKLEAEQ